MLATSKLVVAFAIADYNAGKNSTPSLFAAPYAFRQMLDGCLSHATTISQSHAILAFGLLAALPLTLRKLVPPRPYFHSMLSRSNTTTSDRARRARSIASMQAARQRSSATSDPFVIRQQAEMAATLAYRSSQPVEQPACPDYRPAPPMLQRRRSQVTGRSEGSHLEDARLGRRRSTPLRDGKSTSMARQRPLTEYVPTTQKENESRTKRTSIAQPQPATKSALRHEVLGPPANNHHRNSPFAYSNGSPAARTVSATPGLRSSTTDQTPRHTDKSYDDGISVTYTEPQSYANRIKAERQHQSKISIREIQTDEEIIALARERQLQESQQQKIRERKSFFGSLQMLQKRNPPNEPPGIIYDNSLPPFNYADDSLLAPLPPPNDAAPPVLSLKPGTRPDRKTRAFSTSVKGQFKKLLRKATRAPGGLVMSQHTELEVHGDFVIDEGDSIGLRASSILTDPFIAHDSPLAIKQAIGNLSLSANNPSVISVDAESAADRSRVTSWTNSTTVGTSSTHAGTASTSVVDEHGRIVCDETHPALRKKSSFFGRAVANRLRKPSRADLKSSKESQALFTALRDRILPQDESSAKEESASSVASRTSSALSTLPSRNRAASLAPSIDGKSSTIRTVSPESNTFQIQAMSPLVEASPEHDSAHDAADDRTPTANHYRSKKEPVALQAEPPSPDRTARRVQQSQARWKGALHATSTASDGKITSAYDDDNPYELPSLSHNPYADQETDTGGLPKHTRVNGTAAFTRENLLSPSVYSRATDGASPQPVTPEHNGTKITVTSREVKRYDISPPKKPAIAAQPPIHASGDWRKWLSDEMSSLAGQDEVDSLDVPQHPRTSVTTSSITEYPGRKRAATNGSGSQRRDSDTPSSGPISKVRGRPRTSSRRSSYMNDRYPMIDTSENSSRRTSRKASMASNAGTDTERSLQIPGSDDSKLSINGTVTSSKSGTSQVLPKRHSISNLESLPDSKAASTSKAAQDSISDTIVMSGAIPDNDPISQTQTHLSPPTHYKHKSAFDLRAKYKSSITSTSRPVEVRRKPTVPLTVAVFEDNTIQNISAGPYASVSSSNTRANKENTPPHITDDGGLPAVSSSEWLAGPTGKKRDPKARPKSSPPKTGGLVGTGREGSPGQRMVTGWLEGRKGKGGDGEMAFV